MSILEKAATLLGYEKRSTLGVNGWPVTLAASPVTPTTAESLSAVQACVSAISETIGSLPLHLYRRTDAGREKANDHPLYRCLHDQPNERQSALEFREMMQAAVLLRGNAFARIVRGYDGQVRQLVPIHPDRVRVLDLDSGRLGYEVSTTTGTERLTQDEIFHLRHRSDDGIVGVSPIARSAATLELALAERDHGVSTFQNGAKLLGVLKHPGKMSPEQKAALKASWGDYKAGSTPVLEGGLDYQTVSMSLEDSEWIAARKLSVVEVARLFRVPGPMIGDLEAANYSNVVELSRFFITNTLRRHMIEWEQAIARQLLTDAGRRIFFAEHSVEGLLRGDSLNRAEFYAKALADGWMTTDEVRQLENLPKLPNKFKQQEPPKGASNGA